MDEFLGMAVWILMAFLMVNASIMWFQTSDTFVDNGLNGIGVNDQNLININELDSLQGTDCSTVSSDLLQYPTCILGNTTNFVTTVIGWFWNLFTAWNNVLLLITSGLGSIGNLVYIILMPFFAIVEVFAIMVILLKLAGLVRGGS